MCRTGICRFGIGNWIFLLSCLHLFTYAEGGEDLQPDPGVRFLVEPNDEVVVEGNSVMLPCSAASKHPVSLSWRHSSTGLPTREQAHTANDPQRKQLLNGSLVIENMSAALAGQYQCVASVHNVGTIVSRVATVFLAEVPELVSGPRLVSGVAGSPALLPCGAWPPPRVGARLQTPPPERRVYAPPRPHHAPPTLLLNVTWLRNGIPISEEAGRVAVSASGALELDPLGQRDAGVYRCRVALALRPHVAKLGEEIELRVSTDTATEYPPRFVATPQTITVLEGASVTFDCAAVGNPKPEMTWLNNGVEIDLNDLDSRFYRWGGGSLRVQSARALDAGAYTCRAHSRLDSADAAAVLNVLVAPRVSTPSGVVVARERGVALLPCTVRGRPTPSVTWFKDGEPLTPNQHDIVLLDGWSLRIQGVLEVDAGMFQCVATSSVGAAHASLRLLVLPPSDGPELGWNSTKPPKGFDSKSFLNSLVPSIETSSKHTKTRPSYKNSTQDIFNSLITSGHFGDQNNESDLLESDFLGETSSAFTSGPELEYDYNYDSNQVDDLDNSFHAAEGLDSDQIVNASIISPPKNLRAVIVKHRFVTLSWEEPEVKNEEITGYTIMYQVKGSERQLVAEGGARHEMNVAALQPSTAYHFRAAARTHHARSPYGPPLEVQTPAEEVGRGFPVAVRVEAVSPRSARVRWSPPPPPPPPPTSPSATTPPAPSPPRRYRLLYTEIDTGIEQSQLVEVDPTLEEYNATLSGLRPAGAYSVRVAVGGGGGGEEPSSEPVRFRTPGDVPSAAPVNVTAIATGANAILVRWEAPGVRWQHGPLTGFKVRYRANRRRAASLTTPATARRAQLRADPATTYQVRVCALNANGSGPFSEWVGVATPRRAAAAAPAPAPPDTPPPLTTRAGRDWISVWWADEEGGAMDTAEEGEGWVLGWGLGVPDTASKELPPATHSHVIRGLESNSEYVISLRGSNALGLGPAVYATVRTKPPPEDDEEGEDDVDEDEDPVHEQPPELLPPVGLKVIMLSGTTAVVYWTDPTLPKGQPATDGRRYVVRWTASGVRARTYNATDLNCMIDELRPNTHYEFAVKLIRGGRESQWSMLVSNTSLEAPPSSPPRDLRASPPSPPSPHSRAVDLTWSPPAKPNGIITGYVVMYAIQRSGGGEEWIALSSPGERAGEKPRARVDRLRPRTSYLFKVQAKNAKGLGPFCAPLLYTTPLESGEGGGLASATSAWLWASAGGACAVLALALALALSLCCRRHPPLSPDTSTYQKSSASAGIKPPDLWIHHDQMELKHMDKGIHSSASKISAGSTEAGGLMSSTLTLARPPPAEYEPARPRPASLDRRHYVPTYVGSGASCSSEERASPASAASCRRCDYRTMTGVGVGVGVGCAATCERRAHPRHPMPDQSTPLLSSVGPLGSGQASMASLPALPAHPALPPPAPCGSGACPLGAACGAGGGVGGGDIYACAARERGHYVAYEPLGPYTHRDSLSSDATGAGAGAGSLRRGFLDNSSDHSTPAHSRAGSGRETSPYKKSASSSPGHIPNRLQLGGAVGHCPGELEPLTPSRSSERLQREMQNLEGLMKDLSAITQQQFHC